MPSVISGDANVSATEFGFLDGVTSGLQSQIDSKLNLAGGKILQIVRATDSTGRFTTSTTYVDVDGMAVTITPQKSDSAVIIVASFAARPVMVSSNADVFMRVQITDSSNNAISGAQGHFIGNIMSAVPSTTIVYKHTVTMMAYATPATTSAVTYKMRFLSGNAGTSAGVRNSDTTGQMYAIEVSA